MPQQIYGANLSAAKFPMISSQGGRSVIVPLQDNTFVPYNSPLVDALVPGNERNIPQVMYAENVMPTTWGLQAVGFTSLASSFLVSGNVISNVVTLKTSSGNVAYLGVITSGPDQWQAIVWREGTGWQYVLGTWPLTGYTGGRITTAFINTFTYICFEGAIDPLRQLNFLTAQLPILSPTGLPPGFLIKGICAAQGQLIVHSDIEAYWSSTVTPLDFNPSLVTGAGGGTIENLDGPITLIKTNKFGAIVYTRNNAVSMSYSGNVRFPFNFRPISGSAGVDSVELVADGTDLGEHYVYTNGGLQVVNPNGAKYVYPDLTEFLSGYVVESFDFSTCTFSTASMLGYKIYKKMVTVAGRYLVISYGTNPSIFAYALIIDLQLGRYGKIKRDHTDVFEWLNYITYPNDIARQSIVFASNTGQLSYVTLDNANASASGILVLGKFQFVRTRMMGMHILELESPYDANAVTVKLITSLDGKTTASVKTAVTSTINANVHKTFWQATVGRNHMFAISGNFKLSAAQLTVSDEGNVR